MSAEGVNKKKWMLFVKQSKGMDVTEMHVTREDHGTNVVLKYNGKARNGRYVTGEWVVETKDKDAAYVDGQVKDFLERARKNFFVKREGSLAGDAFKGKQDDEAGKAKPLVAGEKPPEK